MRILARPAFANRAGNPYNWLLYTNLSRLGVEVHEHSRARLFFGRYDIWHLHWPESPLNRADPVSAASRLAGLLAMMEVARRRGIKVVWTVHNLAAHEQKHPKVAERFWRAFVPRLDGYISLSAAGVDLAVRRHPALAAVRGFVVPLGHYRGVYPDEVSDADARTELGIPPDADVVAFVGQIRPYKGVPELCRAFQNVDSSRARLLIAGLVKSVELRRQLENLAAADRRIHLETSFIPDERLQVYLRAASVVVLPFVSVLNSSSALLALSYDRPVVLPETPPLLELRDAVGGEWVYTYRGTVTPEILDAGLSWARHQPRQGRPRLDSMDWSVVSQRTSVALQAIRVGGDSGVYLTR